MLKYTLAVLACLLGVGLSAVVQDTKPVVQDTSKCCYPDHPISVKMTQTFAYAGQPFSYAVNQIGIQYIDGSATKMAMFLTGVGIQSDTVSKSRFYWYGKEQYIFTENNNMCFKINTPHTNDRCMPAYAVKTGERTYGEKDKTLVSDVYKMDKTVAGQYTSSTTMDLTKGVCMPMSMSTKYVAANGASQFTSVFYDGSDEVKDMSVFDLPEPCKNAIMVKSEQLPMHMQYAMEAVTY